MKATQDVVLLGLDISFAISCKLTRSFANQQQDDHPGDKSSTLLQNISPARQPSKERLFNSPK